MHARDEIVIGDPHTGSPAVTMTPRLRRPRTSLGPRGNRTIATIIDATRQIFLARGYAGTTVDEITHAAGVSRASFYTYFPSKRDVLLLLGAGTAQAAERALDAMEAIGGDWGVDDLEAWVRMYLAMLDEHGSFVFALTQASHEDEELRKTAMAPHLRICRRMGLALASLGGTRPVDPVEMGIVIFSALERGWMYRRLYADGLDRTGVDRSLARMLAATARGL